MDAPVYKKLSDIESTRENPFQTPFGQDVISIQESFEARLYRHGRPISSFVNGGSYGVSTNAGAGSLHPSPGCELYPIWITFSADQDCVLNIKYSTELSLNQVNASATDSHGILWEPVFIKAGTPFTKRFNGEMRLYEHDGSTAELGLYVTTTATTTKVYTCMYALEVSKNA